MSNERIHKCPECGTSTDMFYCPNCGEIIKYPSFVDNNEVRKNTLQKFVRQVVSEAKQLKNKIASEIDGSVVRNAVYRKYYERIAYLQKLCSNKIIGEKFQNGSSNIFDDIKKFSEKCEEGTCQIAVVGTVKAGKSSFINALIGKKIASSYPTPETASITKFRKSEKGDYVKVSFYNTSEWQELWNSVHENSAEGKRDGKEDFLSLYKTLNAEQIRNKFLDKEVATFKVKSLDELKEYVDKYTSARFPEHFFAKEVEVGLSDFFAPSNVVIVDSPGLDDPVPYRSNITRRYLPKANIVLVCVRSNRAEIPSTELEQLSKIFQTLRYHKEKIIMFGTQIDGFTPDDKCDDMLEYWEKYTLSEYLKYLSSETFFVSKENAKKHIFPISAYYYFDIKKCIDNPNIWQSNKEEDKKLLKRIKEIVQRNYDFPEWTDLVDKYGVEKAQELYRSPRQIFEENKDELLEKTQVPKIRKMILDGPIKNANDIIINDIREEYVRLNTEIMDIASDVATLKQETIDLSEESDIAERIHLIGIQINEKKEQENMLRPKLDELLDKIGKDSKKVLTELKNK